MYKFLIIIFMFTINSYAREEEGDTDESIEFSSVEETKKKGYLGPLQSTSYTDKDGYKHTKYFRHSFQYNPNRKKLKRKGKIQYEKFIGKEGDEQTKGFTWSFQLGGQGNPLMKTLSTEVKPSEFQTGGVGGGATLEFEEEEEEEYEEEGEEEPAATTPSSDSKAERRKRLLEFIRGNK